jgi:hypothetical protein
VITCWTIKNERKLILDSRHLPLPNLDFPKMRLVRALLTFNFFFISMVSATPVVDGGMMFTSQLKNVDEGYSSGRQHTIFPACPNVQYTR